MARARVRARARVGLRLWLRPDPDPNPNQVTLFALGATLLAVCVGGARRRLGRAREVQHAEEDAEPDARYLAALTPSPSPYPNS